MTTRAAIKGPETPDKARDFPPDRGCAYSPSCLGCPLPQCRHDNPTAPRIHRDAQVTQAILKEGLPRSQAAARFEITARTVYRALEQAKKGEDKR